MIFVPAIAASIDLSVTELAALERKHGLLLTAPITAKKNLCVAGVDLERSFSHGVIFVANTAKIMISVKDARDARLNPRNWQPSCSLFNN
ncbi:MAG: hypothetical protein AMJ88_18405, partial [Anaerolineae bacterium SM23_ 63]